MKQKKYDVVVICKEDGLKECAHYDCTLEAAKFWWSRFEGDPEYSVEVREVSESRDEVVAAI